MSEPPDCPSTSCWPVDWGCADEDLLAGLDCATRQWAEELAWATLRSLTAYRVGNCPVTVRPCAKPCGPQYATWFDAPVTGSDFPGYIGGPGMLNPRVVDGAWVNVGCGCTTACSCTYVPTVWLPGPVGEVLEVSIDGVVLDESTYRVDNGTDLVRLDGQAWPKCQDMAAGCDDVGSFCVTYVQGFVPDMMAERVAGILATEYAKSCAGGACRLPSGVTSVTRQGITWEQVSDGFAAGYTGIREVDAYVRYLNPNGLAVAPQVYSPDLRRPRVVTWTGGWAS